MPMLNIHISEDTEKRLQLVANELGRKVDDLAEAAVENAAMDAFRHRKDDPAKE